VASVWYVICRFCMFLVFSKENLKEFTSFLLELNWFLEQCKMLCLW